MQIAELIAGREVISVQPDDELSRALRLMSDHGIRHLPVVVRQGRVVGVISERDILRRQAKLGARAVAQENVSEVMMLAPIVVRADEEATSARDIMLRRGLSCLPVLGVHRELIGIVTRSDLLRADLRAGDDAWTPPDTAGMLMQRAPLTAAADDALIDALERMEDRGIRHLPVVNGDHRVIGMLSDRDVRTAIGDPREALDASTMAVRFQTMRVSDVMSREPLVIRHDAPFSQVVAVFTEQQFSAVPVVDANDRLVGIVSYVDVLRNAGAL